jgi:hypothetical protein
VPGRLGARGRETVAERAPEGDGDSEWAREPESEREEEEWGPVTEPELERGGRALRGACGRGGGEFWR